MAAVRPSAKLTFDNPDADGRLSTDPPGRGFGCDWTFPALRQDRATDPGSFAPAWSHEGTEIVPGMDVLTLRGTAPPAAMSLSAVDIIEGTGYWKLLVPDWQPRANWLAFVNGAAGEDGFAKSKGTVKPRLAFRFVDYVPPAGYTGNSSTGINLLGDGTEDHGYSINLPIYSSSAKYPRLYRGQPGSWTLVDEFDRLDAAAMLQGQGVRAYEFWVEETDGYLVIRFGNVSEPWVYECGSGFEAVTGKWEVGFEAHQGLANVAPITYPATGVATAAAYISVPADCEQTPGQVVSEEVFGGTGASVVWLTGDPGEIKPEVTLTRVDANTRPLVYCVHEVHEPSLVTRAMETPIETDDHPATLVRLKWERNLYRDWRFSATIRDPEGYWEGVLKPNMKVTAEAGWDGSHTTLMTGYLVRPKPIRQQAPLPTLFELECRDYILGRIAERKFLLETCSPEGWDLGEWADWQIRRAGCGLTTSFPSGTTVNRQALKQLAWRRGATDELLPALDEVFRAHGWVPLSIDPDNVIWSGPETPYAGPPDFVLDESTATGDDIITGLDLEVDEARFRNFVAAHSEAGLIRQLPDVDWTDPESDQFVGDDWWEAQERSGDNALALASWAAEELRRRLQLRQVLTWTRLAAPAAVWPGAYVQVSVDGLGVPEDTIMRVVKDEGDLLPQRMEGYATYTCERVDLPPE